MPTPSEQKALAFVAIVILLAGAVRVGRAGGLARPDPSPIEQQGLARQAFAASSASVSQRNAKEAKRSSGGRKQPKVSLKRRDGGVNIVGGVASVPPDPALNRLGFPPPGPRLDVGSPSPDGAPYPAPDGRRRAAARVTTPIDLDSAPAEDIESLPKVGPALARRIVADRDSLGPFRSLAGLRRVKGIGPATAALLAPLVTFSGQTRP